MKSNTIFDVSGRVALITGGGGGLGRVFCEAMAEFGADVACCDIDKPGMQETIRLVNKYGVKTLGIKADVSKPDEVQYMVNEVEAKFGTIDILINNAGIATIPEKIHEMSIANWDKVITINLTGVFLCLHSALPIMLKRKRGCIINIASISGIKATHPKILPQANYSASKAGVISLTRQAAMEYARDGIRVNCIIPGHHAGTQISHWGKNWTNQDQEKFEEMIVRTTPMGRPGRPSELKGLAVYLASDASSYVTGQVFVQDGGASI